MGRSDLKAVPASVDALDRAWCEQLASHCNLQRIQPNGQPYLDRYFVHGWQPAVPRPGPSVYLHHFLGSDPDDAVHSHPWHAVSFILVGSYREFRCHLDGSLTVRDFAAGDVNRIGADDRHRIQLLTKDVWTLFLVSNYVKPWQFFPVCGGQP